jgi:hypothetical protein
MPVPQLERVEKDGTSLLFPLPPGSVGVSPYFMTAPAAIVVYGDKADLYGESAAQAPVLMGLSKEFFRHALTRLETRCGATEVVVCV